MDNRPEFGGPTPAAPGEMPQSAGHGAAIGVKICGLTDAQGLEAAVAHRADWVGFVFHPASPRFITPDAACALSGRAPRPAQGGPLRVALLVKPDDALVATVCRTLRPDILQIYAPDARVVEIRARTALPTWAAIGVTAADDLPRHPFADGFVIETRAAPGADRPGGNGLAFDWSILQCWTPPAPFLLAGGLTPDNVARARRISGARKFDVSSGVEDAPGHKSPDLIARFIAASRSA